MNMLIKHGAFVIREIEKKDDADVETLIRTCLLEFGENREGTAWCDPDLHRFSEVYNKQGYQYWVVENSSGSWSALIWRQSIFPVMFGI